MLTSSPWQQDLRSALLHLTLRVKDGLNGRECKHTVVGSRCSRRHWAVDDQTNMTDDVRVKVPNTT